MRTQRQSHIACDVVATLCLCAFVSLRGLSAIEVARLCMPVGKALHIGWQDFATMMAGLLKLDA